MTVLYNTNRYYKTGYLKKLQTWLPVKSLSSKFLQNVNTYKTQMYETAVFCDIRVGQ
jgi:hypothetical protein